MSQSLSMRVSDMFRFADGRTVFVGEQQAEKLLVGPRQGEIWCGGELCGVIRLDGEELPNRADLRSPRRARAVSTPDPIHLERADLGRLAIILQETKESNQREFTMHRHLLGLESPPADYVADPMTLGPVLPEGWDGDAWMRTAGGGYFLRAWNKTTGRVAYGKGTTYQDARQGLLEQVAHGKERVVISMQAVA